MVKYAFALVDYYGADKRRVGIRICSASKDAFAIEIIWGRGHLAVTKSSPRYSTCTLTVYIRRFRFSARNVYGSAGETAPCLAMLRI